MVQRMRIACCITKATNAHSEYVILLLFYGNNGYANAPRCYDIRQLRVLFLQLSNLVALCDSLIVVYSVAETASPTALHMDTAETSPCLR